MLGLTKSIYLVCSVTVLMRTCLEKILTARWTHMILLFTSSQLLCKSVSIIFWPRCSFYVFKYSQWISLPWIYLTSLSSSKLPSVQCHLARASTAYLYVWDWQNEWIPGFLLFLWSHRFNPFPRPALKMAGLWNDGSAIGISISNNGRSAIISALNKQGFNPQSYCPVKGVTCNCHFLSLFLPFSF